MMIDLQCHTVASDGESTSEEIIDLALEKGLFAIAITDHDTLEGVFSALNHAKGKNIEVVSGIELSCDDSLFHYDKIDVLGLLVDPTNNELLEITAHINSQRIESKKSTIKKLNELGYDITFEKVKQIATGTMGRPHIAKCLLKRYPDKFSSVADVFDKLIGTGKPAFVETHDRVSFSKAISAIKAAGGVSILAHPGVYPREDSVKIIEEFIRCGGDGIETYYPYHIVCPQLGIDAKGNEQMIAFYQAIAKKHRLLESGGNDHHGNYRFTMGEVSIPDVVLDNLKQRKPLS